MHAEGRRPGTGPLLCSVAVAMALGGCGSTRVQQLELKRDQLLRIEASATQLKDAAAAGELRPEAYDMYLMINRSLFDSIMSAFDGAKVQLVADGRPVEFTLTSIRMDFRPGNPNLTVVASARDTKTGLEAAVDMDARLLVERDPQAPDALHLRLVGTRIVPRLSWNAFEFTRPAFAKRLLALEATKLTERLPRIALPTKNAFAFGGPAGAQSLTFDTRDGRITGTVRYPATQTSGHLTVKHVVFLRNGVHLFANVEGM